MAIWKCTPKESFWKCNLIQREKCSHWGQLLSELQLYVMEEYLKRVEGRNDKHAKQSKKKRVMAKQRLWFSSPGPNIQYDLIAQRRFCLNNINLDTHFYGSGYVITWTQSPLGPTVHMMMLEIQHSASRGSHITGAIYFQFMALNMQQMRQGWYIIMSSNKTAVTHLIHAHLILFLICSNRN